MRQDAILRWKMKTQKGGNEKGMNDLDWENRPCWISQVTKCQRWSSMEARFSPPKPD